MRRFVLLVHRSSLTRVSLAAPFSLVIGMRVIFSSKQIALLTFHSIGGRIDHAHHSNKAVKALGDTVALNEAVTKAVKITRRGELHQFCAFCQSLSQL